MNEVSLGTKVAITGLLLAFGGYYSGDGSNLTLAVFGIFPGIAVYSVGFFKVLARRRRQTENIGQEREKRK